MDKISEVYNEDCMIGMARYPDKYFELAIVDPPYGNIDAICLKNNTNNRKHETKRTEYVQFKNEMPEEDYFNELIRVSKKYIIWGGNYFGLSGGVIVWQKNGTAFGEGEIAICNTHKSVRFFEFTWNGMIQHDMKNKENRIHPTQKPVALYKWLLKNYANAGDKILDTHMGSQSSRIAAHDMGLDYYGWEIDEDYFKDGCKRFDDYKQQLKLFK